MATVRVETFQRYRARARVPPILWALAGGAQSVTDQLLALGFTQTRVWTDPAQLPPDWPPDKRGFSSTGTIDDAGQLVFAEGLWPGPASMIELPEWVDLWRMSPETPTSPDPDAPVPAPDPDPPPDGAENYGTRQPDEPTPEGQPSDAPATTAAAAQMLAEVYAEKFGQKPSSCDLGVMLVVSRIETGLLRWKFRDPYTEGHPATVVAPGNWGSVLVGWKEDPPARPANALWTGSVHVWTPLGNRWAATYPTARDGARHYVQILTNFLGKPPWPCTFRGLSSKIQEGYCPGCKDYDIAIPKHNAWLEGKLGMRLLHRAPRGLWAAAAGALALGGGGLYYTRRAWLNL